jgi:hypothetical protein
VQLIISLARSDIFTDDVEFIDCLKRKFTLEMELKMKSEDEIYEIF